MAVAWTEDGVGHAQSDVIVRDPVVITAGLPRFLAPGDSAVMRLDITNTDGPDGDYALSIDTTGDLSTGSAALPGKLTLAKRQAADADGAAVAEAPATPRSPSSSPMPTAPLSSRRSTFRCARRNCR